MKRGDGRRGGRKSPHGGRKQDKDGGKSAEQLKQQAEALVRDTGIPRPWAFQVARGETSLNDVLKRLAVRDRVDQLERRHGIDRSLAFQVARGEVELDDVLFLQRMKEHVATNKARSILDEAAAAGTALVLLTHDLGQREGIVTQVTPYEVHLDDGQPPLHKLQIKLAWHAGSSPDGTPPEVGEQPDGRSAAAPVKRPQDRYHLPDKRAFAAVDSATRVRLTSSEGDVVEGVPTWVGRWELGLRQGRGQGIVDLVFFRHALARFEEL